MRLRRKRPVGRAEYIAPLAAAARMVWERGYREPRWAAQAVSPPRRLVLLNGCVSSKRNACFDRDLRIVFLRSNRISNRIGRPIRFRIEFSNRIGRIFNPYHRHLFCICHEREWCTQLSTCYSFQFSPKTRQIIPLYDYLTPKLDFKRKFNHRQSFRYKGRLTIRTIRKFRIGSSLRIESRIGSSIRNRIESRSFAGP